MINRDPSAKAWLRKTEHFFFQSYMIEQLAPSGTSSSMSSPLVFLTLCVVLWFWRVGFSRSETLDVAAEMVFAPRGLLMLP